MQVAHHSLSAISWCLGAALEEDFALQVHRPDQHLQSASARAKRPSSRSLSLSLSSFLFLSPCLQELAEFRRLLTSTSSLRRRAPRLRQLLPNCTSALPGSCEEQLCLEHRWPEKSQKSSDVLWASVCLPATGAGAAGLSSEPPAPQEAPGSAAVTEVSEAERRKPALSFKSFASSCLDLIRDSIT